jgi:hypothetical protein
MQSRHLSPTEGIPATTIATYAPVRGEATALRVGVAAALCIRKPAAAMVGETAAPMGRKAASPTVGATAAWLVLHLRPLVLRVGHHGLIAGISGLGTAGAHVHRLVCFIAGLLPLVAHVGRKKFRALVRVCAGCSGVGGQIENSTYSGCRC